MVNHLFLANAEQWNNTSWTAVPSLNSGRTGLGGSGATSTNALAFGGSSTPPGAAVALTESFDGTSWTEVADLGTASGSGVLGAGTSAESIAAGGYTTTNSALTFEWTTTPAATFTKINLGQVYYNSGSNAFKVTEQAIPTGTWASGTALNSGRNRAGSSSSSNSALKSFAIPVSLSPP